MIYQVLDEEGGGRSQEPGQALQAVKYDPATKRVGLLMKWPNSSEIVERDLERLCLVVAHAASRLHSAVAGVALTDPQGDVIGTCDGVGTQDAYEPSPSPAGASGSPSHSGVNTTGSSAQASILPSGLSLDRQAAWGQAISVDDGSGNAGKIRPISATWAAGPMDSYGVGPYKGYFLVLKVEATATRGTISPWGSLALLSPSLRGADGTVQLWAPSKSAGADAPLRKDPGADDLLDVSPADGTVYGYIVYDVPVDHLEGWLVYAPDLAAWDLSGMH